MASILSASTLTSLSLPSAQHLCQVLLTLALPFSCSATLLAADTQSVGNAPAGQTPQMPAVPPVEVRTPGIYLGVFPQTLSEQQANTLGVSPAQGVYLLQVIPNSPASKAGLQRGDVLVSINGQTVVNTEHFRDLLRKQIPGQAMTLGIVRNKQLNTVTVIPEKPQVINFLALPGRPFSITISPSPECQDPAQLQEVAEWLRKRGEELRAELAVPSSNLSIHDRKRLGIRTQPLSDQLARYFGTPGGLLITEVAPGSPAEKAGLRAGDCLLRIGDQEVRDSRTLLRALRQVEASDIQLTLIRDKQPVVVTVKLEPCAPQGSSGVDLREPLGIC
ncbi:MAG: PDZ domain-containing protein [Acidobacteriota bacterium]